MEYYRQCTLTRAIDESLREHQVRWLPEVFAHEGTKIVVKETGEQWTVIRAWRDIRIIRSSLNEVEQDFKYQRRASDI